MQGSDLNSPVIPQRLLAAEQQQISPGIEQLILKAESENAEAVKLIETDKQRYSALLRQLDEKTRQVEGLEKSTSQLDEEAKQLYKQFTQNREICESLKRTNSVLQEHEEALLKKKEMVLVKAQQSRLENQGVLAKYQAIWDRYKKQYDRRENAKELERVKSSTMKDEEELERIKCAVLNMQTGISSMETDKKNMEETIERGFRSAIPVILKLAQLNLETRATADSIQEVTTKVMQTTKELATISEEKKQQNKSPNKGAPMMELPQAPLQSPVRPSLHLASPLVHNIASTPKPMQTKRDDHSHVEEESSEDRSMDKQHDEMPPTRGLFHAQNEHVPLITASQQFSTSDTQAVQTTSVAKDKHCTEAQIQTSQSDMGQIGCSVANSTAINENHTEEEPVFPATPISTGLQSNTGFTPSSEASNSPFNFEMHSNIIQQLTKSPGDGFLFQSRPMFDSSVEREKELAKTENTNFIFNIEEARNLAPTGSGSEFQMSQQNSNFFGSPVSEESEGGAGFFGTSLPTFSGCSIFGEASPNQTKQQQKTTAFHEFSFSFGNNSPSTTDNTPDSLAAFSLF